jgi:hypothetical protein
MKNDLKDHASVFTGAGIRKTKVEFFATSAFGQAQAWITADL